MEILIIESDLAKRPRCIKDRHFIEIYLKSEVNDTDGIFQEIRASLNCSDSSAGLFTNSSVNLVFKFARIRHME